MLCTTMSCRSFYVRITVSRHKIEEPWEDLPAGTYTMRAIKTEKVDTSVGPTMITTVQILDKKEEE